MNNKEVICSIVNYVLLQLLPTVLLTISRALLYGRYLRRVYFRIEVGFQNIVQGFGNIADGSCNM